MCACDSLDNICFNYQFKVFTFSNIKRLNNKSSYRIVLVLSSGISLNPGPKNNLHQSDPNEWNVFKLKGFHLLHLNINILLPKIDKLKYIAKSSNLTAIGIFEFKLNEFVLLWEIQIKNYGLLWKKKKKQKWWRCCLLYQKWDKLYPKTILSWRNPKYFLWILLT